MERESGERKEREIIKKYGYWLRFRLIDKKSTKRNKWGYKWKRNTQTKNTIG